MNNWFVYSDDPWFDRGSNYLVGTSSGVFSLGRHAGYTGLGGSFRVITMIKIIIKNFIKGK